MSTREEMLACVDRELKMRERVYPDWVAQQRMSEKKSQHELATMRAVREVVAALPVVPPAQADLFGATKATPAVGALEARIETLDRHRNQWRRIAFALYAELAKHDRAAGDAVIENYDREQELRQADHMNESGVMKNG